MATDIELGRIATVAAAAVHPAEVPPGRVLNWRRVLALSLNVAVWGLILSAADWFVHRTR